jgi:Domain of unknown function (DUF4157)
MAEFREPDQASIRSTQASDDAERAEPVAGLAATLGNDRVGRVLRGGVQRSGATSAQQLDDSVARSIEQRRGRGSQLDDTTRTEMESALGQDLSDVRVHTDGAANELSSAVSARAFTTGSDVFFKAGTYDPHSSSGRELLAHELTHVAQQREGTSGLAAGEVSHPSDNAERDAAAVGKAVANGASGVGTAGVATGRTPGVARDAAPEAELEEEPVVARAGETDPVQRHESEDLEEGAS